MAVRAVDLTTSYASPAKHLDGEHGAEPSGVDDEVAAPDAGKTTREDWAIFSAVVLAAWSYTTATTIGNAVLPQMQGDLSASLDQISWVVTASVMAGAIGIPPTPWLAARLGVKKLLLTSLAAFALASFMIGLSSTLGEVILWRIAQAFFGAPILVLSQTITMDRFPLARRGPAIAIWSAAGTTGWVMGPTLGAYLGEWYGWEWSFAILAPISVVSLLACLFVIPSGRREKEVRLDWTGFVSLSVCLLCMQIVLNRGERQGWFESGEIFGWLLVGTLALLIYVFHTLTSSERLIRWVIFKDRNFAVGIAISAAYAFLSLAPLVMIPGMLQQLKGLELITVGLLVVPRALTQIVFMLALGPVVTRLDARIPIGSGLVLFAIGNWMMASYNQDVGLWQVYLPQLLHGAASALVWLPIFNMLYATLPGNLRTDAATVIGLVYSLGGSASIAILVSVLTRGAQVSTEELGGLVVSKREIMDLPEYSLLDFNDTLTLATLQSQIAEQALMISYVNVFWLLTGLSLVVLPLLLLVAVPRSTPPG